MNRRLIVLATCLALSMTSLGVPAEPGGMPGVTPDGITIGLHLPLTGALAVSDAETMETGARLYWRYLHDELGASIHGRRVDVMITNDHSQPSMAVQACDEMAGSSFLMLGFIGATQIANCAAVADQLAVPYFTPGAQEGGLRERGTYAALSATWRQQAPVVAEYVVNRLDGEVDRYGPGCPLRRIPVLGVPVPVLPGCGPDGVVTIGLIRSSDTVQDEVEHSLREHLDARGRPGMRVYTTTKAGDSNEADSIAAAMEQDGVDVVVSTLPSLFTAFLTGDTANRGYFPHFLFLGVGSGLNVAPAVSCGRGQLEGSSAFMPWPSWSAMEAGEFDPDFVAAVQRFVPADLRAPPRGDLLVAMWGLMKTVHRMLLTLEEPPTRDRLIEVLDAGYADETGVYPPVEVNAQNRFGAPAMHRLQASCRGEPQWHLADAFVTGYPPTEG